MWTDGHFTYMPTCPSVRFLSVHVNKLKPMKTQSEIKALKQYPITAYLATKGMNPLSSRGSNYMYSSPLRQDSTPSFSVNPTLNVFNDFGNDSDRGGIIDLVMKLENISFPQACLFIENLDSKKKREGGQSLSLSCRQTFPNEKDYKINLVKTIQHPALIRYLNSRSISLNTAFCYLSEIHYENLKGKFFGLGYRNDNGGYVLRSELMKKPISLGSQGIKSFEVANSTTISIFEGMFDFLSAIEYCKRPPRCTAIILNSVNNLSKAIPQLKRVTAIYSYLDNDDAGRNSMQKMKDIGLNVSDQSSIYSIGGFKDFNEFLIKSTKPP
jgi:hypothetical protein